MKLSKPVFQSLECLSQEDILLYQSGKSDDGTRYRVENHILDCPLCSAAIEGFAGQDSNELAEDLERLQASIKARSTEILALKPANDRKIWSINRIAAAILMLIIPLAALLYWNSQSQNEKLLAQFGSATEIMEGLRSSELMPENNEYKEGLEFFREGSYNASLQYFEGINEVQPENGLARFYSGVSALQIGETDKAIEQLTIVRLNDQSYYEHASFYLILANIKKGDKEEAKRLIEDLLKNEGSFYAGKAKAILEELE